MPLQTAHDISVRERTYRDEPLLEEMYKTFEPLGSALGLPPPDEARRRCWLAALSEGINFVAFVEGKLVGHLALMPDGPAVELTAFVHQDFRRRGIATALAEAAIAEARARRFTRILVFVDAWNGPARLGLRKVGFRLLWEDRYEAEYTFELTWG